MSDSKVDILLVEDDKRLAELTARYLEQNDLRVIIEPQGDKALQSFRANKPKLVLLDLMLPGLDGLSICRELREIFSGPILVLTAKNSDLDQVICLEAGADDFVSKPTDPMVLLARVRVLLRRIDESIGDKKVTEINLGDLKINFTSQAIFLGNKQIELTTHEFELLALLAKNAGKILSRESLFQQTRGIDYDGLDRSIDVRISKLRKKLDDDGPQPKRIKTIWGKGYLLVPEAWN